MPGPTVLLLVGLDSYLQRFLFSVVWVVPSPRTPTIWSCLLATCPTFLPVSSQQQAQQQARVRLAYWAKSQSKDRPVAYQDEYGHAEQALSQQALVHAPFIVCGVASQPVVTECRCRARAPSLSRSDFGRRASGVRADDTDYARAPEQVEHSSTVGSNRAGPRASNLAGAAAIGAASSRRG